ncbi:unnamed protein product [Brassica napus]|uniref:(rape) hypothetical protein n=1 Tax=Brassica napus TaxID=3708 RepID=A0A816PBM3_BRANA|nr:unnamed protein product [Brassica napus]
MACDEVVDELDENEEKYEEDDQEVESPAGMLVTEEDWTMRLCMTVFLGNNNVYDVENHELPRLVYFLVRPGFDHHKKAGAMNSLVSNYA